MRAQLSRRSGPQREGPAGPVDEIWSFTTPSKRMCRPRSGRMAYGDIWTWTAIEADTKLIISWLVGGRDGDYAMASWMTCGHGSQTACS